MFFKLSPALYKEKKHEWILQAMSNLGTQGAEITRLKDKHSVIDIRCGMSLSCQDKGNKTPMKNTTTSHKHARRRNICEYEPCIIHL